MNFITKLIDKLYLKQWSIGIANENIEDVIRNKKISQHITWIPINNNHQFFADPFIFKSESGKYCILYEQLDYNKKYGNISQFTLNNRNKVTANKVMLDTKSHLSYPFIFYENNKMYLFPESSANGKLSCYEYNYRDSSLNYIKDIINLPLLDSTVLKYQNKYWIFSTMKGDTSNNMLYIFYADSLLGPYTQHPHNPVKDSFDGTRPAGNLIVVDDNLYRPTQCSGKYYGASLIVNKVLNLTENSFEEAFDFEITPSQNHYYNFGLHTINYAGNKIVVDGLARRFMPFTQSRRYFSNHKDSIEFIRRFLF